MGGEPNLTQIHTHTHSLFLRTHIQHTTHVGRNDQSTIESNWKMKIFYEKEFKTFEYGGCWAPVRVVCIRAYTCCLAAFAFFSLALFRSGCCRRCYCRVLGVCCHQIDMMSFSRVFSIFLLAHFLFSSSICNAHTNIEHALIHNNNDKATEASVRTYTRMCAAHAHTHARTRFGLIEHIWTFWIHVLYSHFIEQVLCAVAIQIYIENSLKQTAHTRANFRSYFFFFSVVVFDFVKRDKLWKSE